MKTSIENKNAAVTRLAQAAKRIIVSTGIMETDTYLSDELQFPLVKALQEVEKEVLGVQVQLEKCVCCDEDLTDSIETARGYCDECSDDEEDT